jgi:hypothetical protein
MHSQSSSLLSNEHQFLSKWCKIHVCIICKAWNKWSSNCFPKIQVSTIFNHFQLPSISFLKDASISILQKYKFQPISISINFLLKQCVHPFSISTSFQPLSINIHSLWHIFYWFSPIETVWEHHFNKYRSQRMKSWLNG